MSKKVLLLGGAGFIGFNIAKYLSENRDYKISIADNFARGKQDDDFNTLVTSHGITVVPGDYTDPAAFEKLEPAYDQVYMLASVV
jgi:nucleoside-diphosphate-sugar epimerase